jgi:phosphoribosylglycinamide formyltransferase-1
MTKKKVVVALSGSGRTLLNLLKYGEENKSFEVVGVITSRKEVYGAEIARNYGIPLYFENFSKSFEASSDLSLWLESLQPDLIVLAGFLKIFPTRFEGGAKYPTVNIHPSLLPKFSGQGMYGAKVHEAVLQAHEKYSGASVHFVNEIYDEGPLLAQIKVEVLEEDSVESLAARVFEAECAMYPKVIVEVLKGNLPVERRPLLFNF